MATKNEKWLISLGFDVEAFKDSINKAKMEADGVVASYDEIQSEINKKVTEIINQIDKLFQNYGSSLNAAFGDKARSQIRGMTDPLDTVVDKLKEIGVEAEKTGKQLSELKLSQEAETDVAYSKIADMGSINAYKRYISEAGEAFAGRNGLDTSDLDTILNEWSKKWDITFDQLGDKVEKADLKEKIAKLLKESAEIGVDEFNKIMDEIPENMKRISQKINSEGKVVGANVDIMIDKYRQLSIVMKQIDTDAGNQTFVRASQRYTDTSFVKGIEDYEKALKKVIDLQNKYDTAVKSNDPNTSYYKYLLDDVKSFAEQIKVCITNTEALAKVEQKAAQYADAVTSTSTAREEQQIEAKNIAELNRGVEQQIKLEAQVNQLLSEQNQHSQRYVQQKQSELQALEKHNRELSEQITNTEELAKVQQKLEQGRALNEANQAEADYNSQLKEYISLIKELAKAQKELNVLEKAHANTDDIQASMDYISKLEKAEKEYSEEVRNSDKAMKAKADAAAELDAQQRKLTNNTNRLGAAFGTFSNKLKETLANTIAYTGAFQALDRVGDAVYQSVEKIRELDTAMTDIQMVTGYTDDQTYELMQTYNDLARQLGVTTQVVAEGAGEWLFFCLGHLKSP